MNELKVIGGARIGLANATWPFATLIVSRSKLQLNATIIGNLVFKPGDILAIAPYFVFLGKGLKIIHKVPQYNEHVVFWTMGSPSVLLKRIEATGFLDKNNEVNVFDKEEINQMQSQGGFPIKTSAAIVFVVVFNILALIGYQDFFAEDPRPPSGLKGQLGTGFILIVCLLLLFFPSFRRLFLKEGRSIDEIRTFIYFVMLITGIIFLSSVFF